MSNPEGVRNRSAATKPGRSDDPPVGLASTVESADDAIITQDLNDLITSWNAGAERMFGYSPREARGQPISILIPVDIQEAEAAICKRILSGERVNHYETVRAKSTGAKMDVSVSISVLKEKSKIVGLVTIARDITTRKRGERAAYLLEKRGQEELEARTRQFNAALAKANQELAEHIELLDLATDAIVVLNTTGDVVFWNQGAERLYGWTRKDALGKSPQVLLQTDPPLQVEEIQETLYRQGHWECELTQTTRDGRRITVASRFLSRRDQSGHPSGWLQICTDVTRRKNAEQELRGLSGRVLTLRDEERRRIARELHDSAGQVLSAASINLALLERQVVGLPPKVSRLISESSNLIEQAVNEIRTISYLLHPPLLDEVGVARALRVYVEGFSERSKIKVALDISPELGRFSRDLEIAIFRIIQEGLTNIHRHSRSSTAKITIHKSPTELALMVEDRGQGMILPMIESGDGNGTRLGVGIRGMRERVQQFGGQLVIRSGESGTAIECRFPFAESDKSSAHSSAV